MRLLAAAILTFAVAATSAFGALPFGMSDEPTAEEVNAAIAEATLRLMAVNYRRELPRIPSLEAFIAGGPESRDPGGYKNIVKIAVMVRIYDENSPTKFDVELSPQIPSVEKRQEIYALVKYFLNSRSVAALAPMHLLLTFSEQLSLYFRDAAFQRQMWRIHRETGMQRPDVDELSAEETMEAKLASIALARLAAASARNLAEYRMALDFFLTRDYYDHVMAVIFEDDEGQTVYAVEKRFHIPYVRFVSDVLTDYEAADPNPYAVRATYKVITDHLLRLLFQVPSHPAPTPADVVRLGDDVKRMLATFQYRPSREHRKKLRHVYARLAIAHTPVSFGYCGLRLAQMVGLPKSTLLDMVSSWPLTRK